MAAARTLFSSFDRLIPFIAMPGYPVVVIYVTWLFSQMLAEFDIIICGAD